MPENKSQWFEWAYTRETILFLSYTAAVCTVRWSWELNGVMSTDTVFELNNYPRDDGHLHKIGTLYMLETGCFSIVSESRKLNSD